MKQAGSELISDVLEIENTHRKREGRTLVERCRNAVCGARSGGRTLLNAPDVRDWIETKYGARYTVARVFNLLKRVR